MPQPYPPSAIRGAAPFDPYRHVRGAGAGPPVGVGAPGEPPPASSSAGTVAAVVVFLGAAAAGFWLASSRESRLPNPFVTEQSVQEALADFTHAFVRHPIVGPLYQTFRQVIGEEDVDAVAEASAAFDRGVQADPELRALWERYLDLQSAWEDQGGQPGLGDAGTRKHLDRERQIAYRLQNRATLDRLRAHVASLRANRRATLADIVTRARQAKEEVRARYAVEIEQAEGAVQAERQLQRQVRSDERKATQAQRRSTARERRQESDQAVRNNIPEELWPLWAKAKATIKGSPRRSRTEEFLEYVEENPEHAQDARIAHAEAALARTVATYEAEQRKAAREARGRRVPRSELEEAPF